MRPEDVFGRIRGILTGIKERPVGSSGVDIYTVYEFNCPLEKGGSIRESLWIPEMTDAHREGARPGDDILIEKTQNQDGYDIVRIQTSRFVERRPLKYAFLKRVITRESNHSYEWPLSSDQNL